MKNLALVVLLLFSSLVLKTCKDPYGDAVKAGADIAQGISAGMKTVDQLRVSGVITPQEESNALDYLEFANKGNGAFLSCVSSVHTVRGTGSYTGCAQTFAQLVSDPAKLELIHVRDPKAQADVQAIANGIAVGINSVIVALGGK